MRKHLLVTVSNDSQNLSGVQFVCGFFKKISEHQLTLFHICILAASEMDKALFEMWTDPDEKVDEHLTVGASRALEKASSLLKQSRMSIESIKVKTVAERYGKVKDILREGQRGLYDAIILGRRASYTLQWIFERPADETPHSMIRDSCFTSPIWICPEPDLNRKNVLLAIDGSENSLRAVDHVGYILALQEQHDITLFHADNGTCPDKSELFKKSRELLNENGIIDSRIAEKSSWSLTVSGTILSEVERGGYSAVAVGLHGMERGLLKEYNLAGGTTAKLISKIEKSSLWCVP
jgi:hypothetical protein